MYEEIFKNLVEILDKEIKLYTEMRDLYTEKRAILVKNDIMSLSKVDTKIIENYENIKKIDLLRLDAIKMLGEDAPSMTKLIELSEKYDVCVHVYDNGKYIVSKEDFPIKSYVQKEQTIDPIIGLEHIETYKFDKMLILGKRDILNELYKEISENTDVHSSFSGDLSLEITSKIGNKGKSLEWICHNKGISPDNTIAFGDNFNDIEMIEYAGIGVAMDNSEEMVKQKANYTTLSNEDDGVGKFLKDIFEL